VRTIYAGCITKAKKGDTFSNIRTTFSSQVRLQISLLQLYNPQTYYPNNKTPYYCRYNLLIPT
jgi:hypothetical protein